MLFTTRFTDGSGEAGVGVSTSKFMIASVMKGGKSQNLRLELGPTTLPSLQLEDPSPIMAMGILRLDIVVYEFGEFGEFGSHSFSAIVIGMRRRLEFYAICSNERGR